jgi:hypothetical protein
MRAAGALQGRGLDVHASQVPAAPVKEKEDPDRGLSAVKTEVNALRAEKEEAEARADYDHHHPKRARSP